MDSLHAHAVASSSPKSYVETFHPLDLRRIAKPAIRIEGLWIGIGGRIVEDARYGHADRSLDEKSKSVDACHVLISKDRIR